MKIAILGAGGREHALAWKLSQGATARQVLCLPGNGGTAPNLAVEPEDLDAVARICRTEAVDLLVVGPEAPLAAGIADRLGIAGLRVLGPGAAGARLESSKAWAKAFMARHGVATAAFRTFDGPSAARAALLPGPQVVKYDGLAAGKGVFVCGGPAEASAALEQIEATWGPAAPVVLEERLVGSEISIMGFTDGQTLRLLLPSQDHKQLLDGDRGPNTGGMGAFCPVPAFGPAHLAAVQQAVVEPTLRGLAAEGIPYRGALYFGLMMTRDGPRLLEYNVRLGDPEAEVLLPALRTDLLEVLEACVAGRLREVALEFHPGFFVDVVLCAPGYPGRYPRGLPITGVEDAAALVFHAGTRREGERLLTSGGRVLNVVGHGPDLEAAIARAYGAAGRIAFEGKTMRRDIGRREWRA
ncbi:MAG: phosphoribosylamine--glycine ligase [Pseudomonadota bacterium]